MNVKCDAITCKFNRDGKCISDAIELVDFEYYKDLYDYEKSYLEDDMKCITYERA